MEHFMQQSVVVVECIIEHEGRFLIIRRPEGVHAGGLLAFVAGKVEMLDAMDEKDILLNAVKREVFEEVGLTLVDPIRYVTSSQFVDTKSDQPILAVIFYTQLLKSETAVKPSQREVPEFFWMSCEEIYQHDNSPDWVKHYLTCALRS